MEIFNSILMLLAGCGVFMAGMKMMGDGLERSAGKGMKKLFSRISNNRFAGVGVGAAVTAIIQSSSATSVMVIGFVNAGVMTLVQAAAIIMGANIGTTVTGIIISFSAFNVSLYASVLAFVGVMMMFFKSDSVKKAGGILCGLGLLFVGLDAMSGAFGDSDIKNAFANMFTVIDFPLLLILIGTLFTALIQSSSAATGLLIIMVGQGALSVANALFIVLGTNIGTCITAVIASIGAYSPYVQYRGYSVLYDYTVVFLAVGRKTAVFGFSQSSDADCLVPRRVQRDYHHFAAAVYQSAGGTFEVCDKRQSKAAAGIASA